MFTIKDDTIKVSVRNLVEFICRGGDLDNRRGQISDKNAMDAGSRAHRKIQKKMGADYQAEVSLKMEFPLDNYRIMLEGRADGIITGTEYVTIDEIKGTYMDLKYLNEPVFVHKAQAMCYAYMYGRRIEAERVGIRMTYVNLDSEEVRYFEDVMTMEEINKWFDSILEKFIKWCDYLYEARQNRQQSIKGLEFPFTYREGQRELAVNVYKSIMRQKNLFIQAPTGVGKTLSTLFPAVKAIGEEYGDKIFYLTAKTITRTVAEESYELLRNKGLSFKTITITAKDKICFTFDGERAECNPDVCSYAKGHFDRVNDAVYDLITHESVISRDVLETYALKHHVCPYEFSLDVAYWMDGVICDYNYVFDPHVFLKRFFADGVPGDYIFLIDEAHNLVERGRSMYSAELLKEDFLAIKKLVAGKDKRLTSSLERCNKNLLELKKECETHMVMESIGPLGLSTLRVQEDLTRFSEEHPAFEYMSEINDFFFKISHFNEMQENIDENYIIYCEHVDEGFMLKLFCVNPSANLKQRLDKGNAAIFFSATLLPINYYKEMLSGNREDYAIYARSTFNISNRLLIVGKDVTSRYRRRNETEFNKIKDYICSIVGTQRGNYLVFFPSYRFLWDVMNCFNGDEQFDILMQEQGMGEQDKEDFIDRFSEKGSDRSLVGMCVTGGIFSEGIDLKEDRLIGSIIVGTGLPQICTERELLRDYYDEKENCGYEYAYIYPGMNKVLQAAGRVIRTENDRGIIALLDERFISRDYERLFPVEWSDYRIVSNESVGQEVLDFWNDMLYNTVKNALR